MVGVHDDRQHRRQEPVLRVFAAVGAQHGGDLLEHLKRVEAHAPRLVFEYDVEERFATADRTHGEQQVADGAAAAAAALGRVPAHQGRPVDCFRDRRGQRAAQQRHRVRRVGEDELEQVVVRGGHTTVAGRGADSDAESGLDRDPAP